ncbi:MAG: PQQ-like beta-propeller repeat protein [Planctomycetales bacterium]|nr:PQQ-like beta-propeller repeat protein [Planctomycetales bacterium]
MAVCAALRKVKCVPALLIAAPSLMAAPPEWPEFRGPNAQGIVEATSAPTSWSEHENVLWKTPLPGLGWSSPVVRGDHVWMTSAVTSGQPKPGENGTQSVDSVKLCALCVSRSTGRLVRELELFNVQSPEAVHSLNGYASPTPCLDEQHVYCWFGRNGTACLQADTGEVLWRKTIVIDHYVGAGSSPVLAGGLLILTCDGADKQFIVALDPATGDEAWRCDRPPMRSPNPDFQKSFCTPLVVNYQGQELLIIPGAQWINAYDPATGQELWRMDHGRGFSLVSRPVSDGESVYFCTGFMSDEVQAIRLGGQGVLDDSYLRWRHKRQAPNQPSPVVHDGRLVLVNDRGIVQCLDTASGDLLWRLRAPGNYSASVMLVNDLYYFFNREGVTSVVSRDGELLHENELNGAQMATPAIVDDTWLLRTDTHLYAIGRPS